MIEFIAVLSLTSHGAIISERPITSKNALIAPVGMNMKYHIRPTADNGNTVGTKYMALNMRTPLHLVFRATARSSAAGVWNTTLKTTILNMFFSASKKSGLLNIVLKFSNPANSIAEPAIPFQFVTEKYPACTSGIIWNTVYISTAGSRKTKTVSISFLFLILSIFLSFLIQWAPAHPALGYAQRYKTSHPPGTRAQAASPGQMAFIYCAASTSA